MAAQLTSPWRTPAALAATRDLKLNALSRARRGPNVAGVDLKLLIFLVPHTCIPPLLCYIGTPLGQHVARTYSAALATPPDVAMTVLALLLLGAAAACYARVYASNPGWVPATYSGTASSAGCCRSCGLMPSLRSRHCRWTGQCVHKMDHYCWFVSTSIGDYNHSWFWLLLLLELVLSCWLLLDVGRSAAPCVWAAALHLLLPAHCSLFGTARLVLLSVLLILGAASVLFFGHLFVLHTYLACTNQTTLELLKGIGMPYMYPFYVVHEGPLSYQVLTCSHLWNLFMHECSGTGPPKPFSQGLQRNLALFFLAKKPFNYVYQFDPPQIGGHDAKHMGQALAEQMGLPDV